MTQSASRAGLIYGVMLLLSVGGMWAILIAGEKLTPPHDLSGEWDIVPDNEPATRPSNRTNFQRVTISQSGRFFQLKIPGRPAQNLELVSENLIAKQHTMVLRDKLQQQVIITGPEEGVYRLIHDDPKVGTLLLRRRYDDSTSTAQY